MNYQWYPGHMTKAKRMMQEDIKLIDLVIELVDARIPLSSRNPDIDELGKNKSRLILLNKADLADKSANRAWMTYFEGKGYHVLDAPVTGGDIGAKKGTLSILVGGKKEDFDACRPLFEAMGTNINYQGEAGCGQHAKLANQIIIAGTLSGVCEALTYAKAKGLDLQTVLDSVSTGAAGSTQLSTFGPKILAEDFAPGFFLKHFVKDMKLALMEANRSDLSLEVLSQVLANYEELEAEGYGEFGTQALMKHYEEIPE